MKSRWLFWAFLAVLSWGVWGILSRLIGDSLSLAASQALSTIGLVPVILTLLFSNRLVVVGRRNRGILFGFGAGVLACLGNMTYYHALNSGAKAATVVTLSALYPVVTVLLAVTILRERLNWMQVTGVGFATAAIYLFNVPQGSGAVSGWLFLALIPIGLWGLAGLLQKLTTQELSGELATLWFLLAFIPTAGLILLQGLPAEPITGRVWMLVALLGFTFALGNFAFLAAFATGGKASVVTPIAGLYPLVSIPIAILLLGEKVGWREAAGIVLAIVAVIALSLETKARSYSEVPTLRPPIPP